MQHLRRAGAQAAVRARADRGGSGKIGARRGAQAVADRWEKSDHQAQLLVKAVGGTVTLRRRYAVEGPVPENAGCDFARGGRPGVCVQDAADARGEGDAVCRRDRGPGGEFSPHRQRGIPRAAHDVYGERGMSGVPWRAAERTKRGGAGCGEIVSRVHGARYRRGAWVRAGVARGVSRRPGAGRCRDRNRATAALSFGNGARLPDTGARLRDALGRRIAARAAGDAAGHGAHRRDLRARRAEHRTARARQPKIDRDAGRAARSREHGARGGARRRHDARGRRDPRTRTGSRHRGRADLVSRHAGAVRGVATDAFADRTVFGGHDGGDESGEVEEARWGLAHGARGAGA